MDAVAPPPDARGASVVAGLVAFLLALVSALATPLMGLSDEPAHAVHAAGVVRGVLAGQDVVRTDADSGWTRTETVVPVPAAYAGLPERPSCFAFRPEQSADCAPALPPDAGETRTGVSTVGTYAPPWYAWVGWPSLVLAPTPALYGMRVLGAALFAVLVAVAVTAVARCGAGRWGILGVAAAITPAAVHLAGGVNPSGTEVAAAVAFWATTARLLLGAPDGRDVGRWVLAGAVLAVARPLGPALVVGVVLMGALALGRAPIGAGWRRAPVARGAVALAVVGVAALCWSLWRGTLSAFSGFPDPALGATGILRRSLALAPERLVEMVGVLGWSDVTLPRLLVGGWLLVVAALVVGGLVVGSTRTRTALVVLALGVFALPILADLRSVPDIGFVWQGRYTLPIAAGLPVLAGIVVGRARRWTEGIATGGIALLGLGHLAALAAVLRRFAVGAGGDLGAALAAPTDAGLAGWVLLVVATVVVGTGVALAARAPLGGHRTA